MRHEEMLEHIELHSPEHGSGRKRDCDEGENSEGEHFSGTGQLLQQTPENSWNVRLGNAGLSAGMPTRDVVENRSEDAAEIGSLGARFLGGSAGLPMASILEYDETVDQ
jgi:hypothetical protein